MSFEDGKTMSNPEALASARIFVCGAGGLGSWVLELLARSGVGLTSSAGFLRAVDPDVVDESNLNRQLFATTNTLGVLKVEAAAEKLRAVNPQVEFQGWPQALTENNALELIEGSQLLIDATDNVAARLTLESAAETAGIPLIHGSVGGLYGQIALIYPGDQLLHKLYAGSKPTQHATTAPAVVAVASMMAQVCCAFFSGEDTSRLLPSGTLVTMNLHDLTRPIRSIRLSEHIS